MLNIGEITLNSSFILYLFLFMPQLWRNLYYKRVADLSFSFHALLFIAATADLYYGFGRIEEWQYRLVSMVMFVCLLTQHIQLFFYQNKTKLALLSLLIAIMLFGLIITLHSHSSSGAGTPFNSPLFITMGWIERIGYWLYLLPQILKNRSEQHHNAAKAISPTFVFIGLLTAILDSISAWSFSWGSPSLYGAPIAVALHFWLLLQCCHKKN